MVNKNKIVIGPGTGLGAAMLVAKADGNGYEVVGGEGGHVTMPARTQREFDIFQYAVRSSPGSLFPELFGSIFDIHFRAVAPLNIDRQNLFEALECATTL